MRGEQPDHRDQHDIPKQRCRREGDKASPENAEHGGKTPQQREPGGPVIIAFEWRIVQPAVGTIEIERIV